MSRPWRCAVGVVLATAVAGCGSSLSQHQIGARSGEAWARITGAFVDRPGTVPTIVVMVGDFNAWIAGTHSGNIPQDVRTAGFAKNPAPRAPLSPTARRAAAAIAIRFLAHTASKKYGPLTGGYELWYNGRQLVYRCRSRGYPPTDFCNSRAWRVPQAGLGS